MRESRIEKELRNFMIKIGGLSLKWTSPGTNGVPDRICFFPDGRVVFVELKCKTGKLSSQQLAVQKMLSELGHNVFNIKSILGLSSFMTLSGYKKESKKLRDKYEI